MHDDKAIEYVTDKFSNFGVVVECEGVRSVLHYYDEYFEKHQSEETGFVIFEHTVDDKRNYITQHTDIPLAVIDAVLETEEEYYKSRMK